MAKDILMNHTEVFIPSRAPSQAAQGQTEGMKSRPISQNQ